MKLVRVHPPRGVFRQVNFMTPNVLAYYHGNLRGKAVYVELSEGEGINHEPLFGVTFRRSNGSELWREPDGDLSMPFHSKAEAMAYIRETLNL